MSFASQTNSGFVNSIQTPTDTVPNAIGLSDIESIRANLTNVQKMVNFDTKAVYVNIIAKYDKIPIQVIDPINISNTFFVPKLNQLLFMKKNHIFVIILVIIFLKNHKLANKMDYSN